MTMTLKYEKETKNTVKYVASETSEPPAFDTLYIQKWAARKANGGEYPAAIEVTVTPCTSALKV